MKNTETVLLKHWWRIAIGKKKQGYDGRDIAIDRIRHRNEMRDTRAALLKNSFSLLWTFQQSNFGRFNKVLQAMNS